MINIIIIHMHFASLFPVVSTEREGGVSIASLPSPTLTQHTYRVACKTLGYQTLTLSVANGPSARNPVPARETATIE